MKDKIILVTGASGFIGKRLVSKLISLKYSVFSISSKHVFGTINIKRNGNNFDSSELHKSLGHEKYTLIHLGASTPKTASAGMHDKAALDNILMTHSLLDQLLSPPDKIIYTSTLDVYDFSCQLINEISPIGPNNIYGYSKYYCEGLIKSYAKQNNILYQILRLGLVYGPGEEEYNKIVPLAIQAALLGDTIQLITDGTEFRSYIYLDDVISYILYFLSLNQKVDSVNLVNEDKITINNLLNLVEIITEKYIKIKKYKFKYKPYNVQFDATKINGLVKLKHVSITEGLKQEIEYFKEFNRVNENKV